MLLDLEPGQEAVARKNRTYAFWPQIIQGGFGLGIKIATE